MCATYQEYEQVIMVNTLSTFLIYKLFFFTNFLTITEVNKLRFFDFE